MAKKKVVVPHRPPRPEVLAFLAALEDEPEDDTTPLVLADWLEEHGDEAAPAPAGALRRGSIGNVDLASNDLSSGVRSDLRAEFWDRVDFSDWGSPS